MTSHGADHPQHDSAGVPFGGREITSTGFDDDTGASDAQLLELLDRAPDDEKAWMERLAGTRLIVPVLAAPTEVDTSGEHAVEKETDMAVVTLTSPDGVRALPVFTGIGTLSAWNPQARPSPVTAARAAQAAISEQCDVLLLDLGAAHGVVVRSSMVWALAQAQTWLPAHEDPFVAGAVERAVSPHDVVRGHTLEDGGEGVLRLRLAVEDGLTQEELRALATIVGESLATDGETRARIEGLAFAFESAP